MDKLKNKFAIGCLVQFYEIELVEEYINSLKISLEVIKNKERKSGISIHLVNEEYDKGEILLQKSCSLTKTDSVESLRIKVQKLEHSWFPLVIENYILKWV